MAFWNLNDIKLDKFRPGIMSRAEFGKNLIMACMEIEQGMDDPGHEHNFDQSGIIVSGSIEMTIGNETKVLGTGECYFIPSGTRHGWRTRFGSAKILDITMRQ